MKICNFLIESYHFCSPLACFTINSKFGVRICALVRSSCESRFGNSLKSLESKPHAIQVIHFYGFWSTKNKVMYSNC
ncbi:hypothetical protein GIB67_028162 [Kingdonia uniflora]|uniref:Uncharacterized protein n=1 Tax=Kingdonia uniflora TaxID=39325 RepID=A0A7J7KZR6_9MAGN|nr:hypothetical protein GIB67_028162 [Kingdonia uniflora]